MGIVESGAPDYFCNVPGMAPMDTVPSKIPKWRKGPVPEVAGAVEFLPSRAPAYISGQTLVVDGGRVDGGLSVVAPPFPEDLTRP